MSGERIFVRISRCPLCGGFWEEHKLKLKYTSFNVQYCIKSGKYFVEIIGHRTWVRFDDEEAAYRYQRQYMKSNRTFGDIEATLKKEGSPGKALVEKP